MFIAEPLQFEPGTKQLYSSAGYIVLGSIIEKLSGQSYYEYIKANVFKPADMSDSDYYSVDEKISNIAQGYTFETPPGTEPAGRTRRNNLSIIPARGSSAGGSYATAKDLFKLSIALRSGKLKSYDLKSPTGQSQQPANTSIVGGTPGVGAVFDVDINSGYTIIVLSNYELRDAVELQKSIKGMLQQLSQ